jgi:hypothetical protein
VRLDKEAEAMLEVSIGGAIEHEKQELDIDLDLGIPHSSQSFGNCGMGFSTFVWMIVKIL